MIPNAKHLISQARFFLLEPGDTIQKGDEYYNNLNDHWYPVLKEFVGDEYDPQESKPVRRVNKEFIDLPM